MTPEQKKEFDKNLKKQMDDGTYLDDGCVEITCQYCGTKRSVIDEPCCEETSKKMKKVFDDFAKLLGE